MKKIKSRTDDNCQRCIDPNVTYFIDDEDYILKFPMLNLKLGSETVFTLIPYNLRINIQFVQNSKINYSKFYRLRKWIFFILKNSEFEYSSKCYRIIKKINH